MARWFGISCLIGKKEREADVFFYGRFGQGKRRVAVAGGCMPFGASNGKRCLVDEWFIELRLNSKMSVIVRVAVCGCGGWLMCSDWEKAEKP